MTVFKTAPQTRPGLVWFHSKLNSAAAPSGREGARGTRMSRRGCVLRVFLSHFCDLRSLEAPGRPGVVAWRGGGAALRGRLPGRRLAPFKGEGRTGADVIGGRGSVMGAPALGHTATTRRLRSPSVDGRGKTRERTRGPPRGESPQGCGAPARGRPGVQARRTSTGVRGGAISPRGHLRPGGTGPTRQRGDGQDPEESLTGEMEMSNFSPFILDDCPYRF